MNRGKKVHDGFVKVYIDKDGREVVEVKDSVAVLVFIEDLKKIVLISQSRLPMIRPDNPEGKITEVPAGHFDLEIGIKGLIIKELKEEIGADVAEHQIRLLNNEIPLAMSPGVITERMHLAFVQINSKQIEKKERIFGADEGEKIVRKLVPVEELESMIFEDMKTFALVQWFLKEKYRQGGK